MTEIDHNDLRSYQKKMLLHFLSSPHKKTLMEVSPGAGKSLVALAACERAGIPERPTLVVCSKKAVATWRRELFKWLPSLKEEDVVFVQGTPAIRRKLWRIEARFYVVTYQTGMNDATAIHARRWGFIIADECKVLKNRKTKTYNFWKGVLRRAPACIMLDGTITARGPQDIWSFMYICSHGSKEFRSFWRYVYSFCEVEDGFYGLEILGPANTEQFQKTVAPYYIRIMDDDPALARERPKLIRDVLPVQMTSYQRRLYNSLQEELTTELRSGGVVVTPNTISQIIRLRQILVCPKIVDPQCGDVGGAIGHLLEELKDDPHVVIFTPFREGVKYIKQAIVDAGFPTPYTLMGGSTPSEVAEVEESFNAPEGKAHAFIATVKFAESYELPSADQAFFVGYDWDQLVNKQAEGRINRLGRTTACRIWYYKYPNTVDDRVIEILNQKEYSVQKMYQEYIKNLLNSQDL